MSDNSVVASGGRMRNGYATFDSLPGSLRAALRDAPFDWHPDAVAEMYRHRLNYSASRHVALSDALCVIYANNAREIIEFSAAHEARYGRPTPHVAAGATVQRYAR